VPAVCVCVREFESHADLNPRACVFACALVCACVFQCARAWASEHIRARSRSAGAGACACACVHALWPALPPRSDGGAHSFIPGVKAGHTPPLALLGTVAPPFFLSFPSSAPPPLCPPMGRGGLMGITINPPVSRRAGCSLRRPGGLSRRRPPPPSPRRAASSRAFRLAAAAASRVPPLRVSAAPARRIAPHRCASARRERLPRGSPGPLPGRVAPEARRRAPFDNRARFYTSRICFLGSVACGFCRVTWRTAGACKGASRALAPGLIHSRPPPSLPWCLQGCITGPCSGPDTLPAPSLPRLVPARVHHAPLLRA